MRQGESEKGNERVSIERPLAWPGRAYAINADVQVKETKRNLFSPLVAIHFSTVCARVCVYMSIGSVSVVVGFGVELELKRGC